MSEDTRQVCERCGGVLETVWLQWGEHRLCWACATPEERRAYFTELESVKDRAERCNQRLRDLLPPVCGSR